MEGRGQNIGQRDKGGGGGGVSPTSYTEAHCVNPAEFLPNARPCSRPRGFREQERTDIESLLPNSLCSSREESCRANVPERTISSVAYLILRTPPLAFERNSKISSRKGEARSLPE